MEVLLWGIIGILVIVVFILSIKIYLLRKGAREISAAFSDRLAADTNTLIDISTRDPYMRALASSINEQLRILRRQRRRYLHGDRELKEAVTNISHDLRTPLTAICGYMELLKQEEKSDEVSRYLSFMENRTEAMKQLTEELFRYSVILSTQEEMEREKVCINHILEESIVGFYGALTERGIIPEISIPETPVERNLNKKALSRVFGNILNNAVKYSDGDLKIILEEDGQIVFSNTASGMSEVQLGRLFDRFFTVEAARNSSGLGLAIAKTLVEQMGGKINAGYAEETLRIILRF